MTTVKQATRLRALRKSLGLSQREMAREFDVTAGAINHWERGTRSIPGPVTKLIDLYESYLDEESGTGRDQFLRSLSSSWSSRLAATLRTMTQVPKNEIKNSLENGLHAFLEGNLSRDALKKNIQVTLLKQSVDSIGQMKGLPLKAAQILTCLSPGLAPELRRTLADLEYIGRPMAPTIAAKVVYEEFGRLPHELFAQWSAKPFAVASIGQVHRARLHTGEDVAVKVQYPHIKKSLESDFRDLRFLQYVASLIKPIDPEILRTIREAVLAECDYQNEFKNIQKFRDVFENIPEIIIPKPHREFSRSRVLTMGYVDGRTLSEFVGNSSQAQRDRAGEIIWKFTMISQLKHGLMNADAHAGNFLFLDGRVAFLDFGRVHSMNPSTVRAYQEFCMAFSRGDEESAQSAYVRLPIVKDRRKINFDEFWKLLMVKQKHLIPGQAFRFTYEYIADGIRAARAMPKDGFKLTPEILWKNCSSSGTWFIFAELGATARWGDIMVESIRS